MATTPTLTAAQKAQVAALLQKYPDLAERIQPGRTGRGLNLADPAVLEYLQLNKSLGLADGYGVNPKTGAVEQRGSLKQAMLDAAKYGAIIATGTYAGASLVPAATTGGVAAPAAGGVLPSTSTVGTAALPSAAPSSLTMAGGSAAAGGGAAAGASGAATAGGTTAAATNGSLWSKLAANPVITAAGIGAGAGLVGTWMQTRAARQAAEIEAESQREALEWQKQQYGVRQRQLAPAIGAGNEATYKIADLLGLKVPEGGYQAPPETQPGYVPPPAQSMPRGGTPQRNPNAVAAPPAVDMVKVMSPTGTPGWIPRTNLDAALKAGAQQVG